MKNLLLLLTTLSLSFSAVAQEDVTSTYLANPSFEADDISGLQQVTQTTDGLRGWELATPSGWNVSGTDVTQLLVSADCFTDNNFGKVTTVPDGSYAYYLRMGWSTGTSTLSQTIPNLPKGKYKVSVEQRSGYANTATSSLTIQAGTASTSVGFEAGSNGFFTTLAWSTCSVTFEQTADGPATLSMTVNWMSGGSCIMYDNVKLISLPEDYEEDEEPTEATVESPTEGVITHDFVGESAMKDDLLQMLANFSTYMVNDYQACAAPNSIGEACGCFKGENTMGNDERGVRPNADLSMICAFLAKYAKGKVTLPAGVTWEKIEDMAMKTLIFAYSTHKANKLKVCSGNNYWGSVSTSDHVWESSLWAMSVAYSAFFQWDKLTDAQKGYVKALLKAECNYELYRSIPTGYAGDTKAEENGWETNILAATLGLFPDDELAPKWFERLREFAINCYSHPSDQTNSTVIDPTYNNKTIANLYKGQNLYEDYTLQNHNMFHTSYQNVVMQELGESALALKLFQQGVNGTEKWFTNALMHHNLEVNDSVLNWLALADGELAMPNGNDWSLFLYDQITSYSTMACFLRDPNALLLENMAYKAIKQRQTTTADGSWLLNPDVGARRMGVEAHRVMMTWLMHEAMSTADLTATTWTAFNDAHKQARMFPSQNIVRAASDDRFTCFSWCSALSSYTGYIASTSPDKNKIIVPFRANNTGNFIGYYTVSGKSTNATPVVNGIYDLKDNAFTMNGELNTNDASLNNRFAIFSTPGNAVIYLDYVRGLTNGTITKEQGGLMAISTDPFTKPTRTLYYQNGTSMSHQQTNGNAAVNLSTPWVNIDNEVGIISLSEDKNMSFGDRALTNSIYMAKLYPSFSTKSRSFSNGTVVDRRHVVYYSRTDAATTATLCEQLQPLTDKLPEGWNGVIAADPDGTHFLLLSNFTSGEKASLSGIQCPLGAPVFAQPTTINNNTSAASFSADINHSCSEVIRVFVKDAAVTAVQDKDNAGKAYLQNTTSEDITAQVSIIHEGTIVNGQFIIPSTSAVTVEVKDGELSYSAADMPQTEEEKLTEGYEDITADKIANNSFELDVTYGNTGNVTLGSATYNPCYTNSTSPVSNSWPNILPVVGWTSQNSLMSSSNFCRMYSMPYSTTMFCVSPSTVGNYAAQCAAPMNDEEAGARCLTVLNSWSKGGNSIYQTFPLDAGTYRVLINMKYECPNQQSNSGTRIIATGNTNTSQTGVTINGVSDYRYPSAANTWEMMSYDFTLTEATDVGISLGFSTSESVGAANNSLLYIDHVRLLKKTEGEDATFITDTASDCGLTIFSHTAGEVNISSAINSRYLVVSVDGKTLAQGNIKAGTGTTLHLPAGIYLINGEKIYVK